MSERCTLAPPVEYDGMICAATAHADVDRCHYCSNFFNLLDVVAAASRACARNMIGKISARRSYIQGGPKSGPQTRDHHCVKSKPIKKISLEKSLGKFVVKWILKLPPHLAYVAALPCET